jgi:DNA polymerase V
MDLEDFGRQMRAHVLSGTGLTIGVGLRRQKRWQTAQWASKEWRNSGVGLSPENPRRTENYSAHPVEEIWGVGNR